MRFHDFISARARGLARRGEEGGFSADLIDSVRSMNSEEVCRYLLGIVKKGLVQDYGSAETAFLSSNKASMLVSPFLAELNWHEDRRPFYNVWPIAASLVESVSLDVQWSEISFPNETILFRFASGHEPYGLASALIQESSRLLGDQSNRQWIEGRLEKLGKSGGGDIHRGEITVVYEAADSPNRIQTILPNNLGGDGETVEDSVRRIHATYTPVEGIEQRASFSSLLPLFRSRVNFLYRLAVFTSLLAKGQDLITPVILSKDQKRYDAGDEQTRRWIEERAARIQGRGFDIGRDLEEEWERSPHWRNPHLCLFWTGEGRGTPLLKVRRGGVVIPKALSEVPTGFMGPETPEELASAEAVYTRTPIPARMRFEILRRDSYRCQLCGRCQSDGVRLHIDHKTAVSRGGSTTEDNLWVLCEPCNLGKSDLEL